MWITFLSFVFVCMIACGVTVPTQQRTSLVPYSLPGGAIDPQHHYVNCGFQVSGSEISYFAKRQHKGPNKYKLINLDLATMTQNETPSDPDTFIEFEFKDDMLVNGFVMNEYPNLLGLIVTDSVAIKHSSIQMYYPLKFLKLDPSTYKIEYSVTFNGFIIPYKKHIKYSDLAIVLTEAHSEDNMDIYVHIKFQYYQYETWSTLAMVKFNTKLNSTLYTSDMSLSNVFNVEKLMFAHGGLLRVFSYYEEGLFYRPLGSRLIGSTNRSVCIDKLDKKRGTIVWRSCYGFSEDDNQYVAMDVYDNNIFLLYQAQTQQFGTNNDDLVLDVIDVRTGMVLSTKVYGSTSDEQGLDLVANQFGIYVMAKIGDGFKDLSSSDDFTTQNSNTNLAIILMDHSGDIQEIESYDMSDAANDINGEEPKKLIIARQNKHDPLYAFIGYRDHAEEKVQGGVYITVVDDNQALFVTGSNLAACSSASANCELCHTNVCFKCEDGYKVQDGVCQATCDDHYYHQHDDADDTKDIDICLPCHETCLTCFDESANGCLTCGTDKVFDNTYNTCSCNSGSANKYLGLNGICVSACDYGLSAIRRNECFKSCPGDSSDFSTGVLSSARDKSASTDCYDLDNHLYFIENETYPFVYPVHSPLAIKPFTLSFWVYINETANSVTPIVNYSLVYSVNAILVGSNDFMLQATVYDSVDNTTHQFNNSVSFSLKEWTYCSVSIYPTNRTASLFQINIATKTASSVSSFTEFQDVELNIEYSIKVLQTLDYNALVVGQVSEDTFSMFSGYINKILVYNEPMASAEMLSYSHKSPFEGTRIYEPRLVIALIVRDYTDRIKNYVENLLEFEIDNSATSPKIGSFLSDPINVCYFYSISECYSVENYAAPTVFSQLEHVKQLDPFVEDGSFSFTEGDQILISSYSIMPSIEYFVGNDGNLNPLNVNFKLLQHSGTEFVQDESIRLMNLADVYSRPCHLYYRRFAEDDIIDLGSYLMLPTVPSVYPIEGHSKHGESMLVEFALDVYNYAYAKEIGDVLKHSMFDEYIALALDCGDVDPSLRVQRQPDGTFDQFDTAAITVSGNYHICWKPPYIDYEGYQVATNGYWTVTEQKGITSPNYGILFNHNFIEHSVDGIFTETDIFQYFTGASNCQSGNEVGKEYSCLSIKSSECSFQVWFPDTSLEMHLCWKSATDGVYSAYERIEFTNGTSFSVTLYHVFPINRALPQILEFSHDNNGVMYVGESFWFSFANSTDGHPNIVPSHNPHNASDLGKIVVSTDYVSGSVVMEQTFTHQNEEQNQGYVKCNKEGEQAGKCFIEGIKAQAGQILRIFFFTNSFSYTDGTNRYYLFGDYTSVSVAYIHLLNVLEDLFEDSNDSIVDRLALKLKTSSDELLYFGSFSHFLPYTDSISFALISLSLYVSGQLCDTPRATVNLDNTISSSLYVTDLDLKNCTSGILMADATVKVKFSYGNLITSYQNGISLGTIGCNEACEMCYGSTKYECTLCSNAYPFYSPSDEECMNNTYQGFKMFVDNQHEIDGSYYTQYLTLLSCPSYYYSDASSRCHRCPEGCTKCTGSKPEDCIFCDFPSPYLLGDSCIEECPDDLYDYDFVNYKCVRSDYYDIMIVNSNPKCQTTPVYSKDNLSVDIGLTGVSSTIMINAGGTLVMNINNKRGNITSYTFTQITPTPDPNDELTNLFPLIDGTTNQYLNETKTVDLNPEAIENYVQGTIFKVMAEVENDCGDKALDYITFVLNPTPSIGTATVTCSSSPCAVLEDVTVTLTGNWYSENIYEMELYIKVTLELPDGTTVLLVPEKWEETTFTFTLPVVSTINETISTRLLITAINLHDNTNTLNKSLTIDNTLPDEYESILFQPDIDLTDLSDLALLSSQMQLILKSPQNILNNNGRVCHRDSDCSNHGICIDSGLACQCDDGYSGVDCSMNSQIFTILTSLVEEAIDFLSGELVTESYIRRSSIQMKFEILTGLLIRPELYEYEHVDGLAKIIEEIANLSNNILLSLSDEFYKVFMNFVSRFYTKIMYEIKVDMQHYIEADLLPTYSSLSNKLDSIKADTENVWVNVEKFLVRCSSKVNSENTFLKYSTDVGTFQTEYKIASSLSGASYTINSYKGYKATFPTDLFAGSILSDLTNSMKLLAISWSISPIMLSNQDSYKIASDVLSIHFIDSDMNTIQISNKSITLTVPFEYGGYKNMTDLSCKAWSLEFGTNTLSDAECTATLKNDEEGSFTNCEECEANSSISITTSHLSSFALIEPTDNSINETEYNGTGNKQSIFMSEHPLFESAAALLFYVLVACYLIGMMVLLNLNKNE